MLICFVFPTGHFHDDDIIDYNYQTTNDVEFNLIDSFLMTSPKQKIIMHQNYETETMLMYLQHPVGIKTFLCKKFLLCQEIC